MAIWLIIKKNNMKKITKLAAAVLLTFSVGFSTVQAQAPKKATVKSMSKSSPKMATKTVATTPVKVDVKTQILGEWKFHEITLRTPKDGFLMHIADQEVNIIKLLIANYTFNKGGSITLDPKYIEKQGVKEANWKLSDSGKLTITYFWTAEKMKKNDIPASENKVELDYKVILTPGKELTLSMHDMFIVNLIRKTKK